MNPWAVDWYVAQHGMGKAYNNASLIHLQCIRGEVRKYKGKRVGKKEDCFTYN